MITKEAIKFAAPNRTAWEAVKEHVKRSYSPSFYKKMNTLIDKHTEKINSLKEALKNTEDPVLKKQLESSLVRNRLAKDRLWSNYRGKVYTALSPVGVGLIGARVAYKMSDNKLRYPYIKNYINEQNDTNKNNLKM